VIDGDQAYRLDDPFRQRRRGELLGPVAALRLLRPLEPGASVVCLLGNWKGRDGRDGPSFFIKPQSSLIDPGDPVVYPALCTEVVYEPEIVIVVGRRARSVPVERAREHVLGWTCANDVTALAFAGATNFPFLPGKSFDTFGVLGPWIETDLDPDNVRLSARVNGEVRTEAHTSKMAWSTSEILSWVSRFMTLAPGDVICCGTPPDYAPIEPGDTVEIEIEGIGSLVNPVTGQRHEQERDT
jgi:2-keto-4-pentenoate hydratase/2-oxohepta-3-ene-1,7-dioic acid hydratase in catechol pathway